MQSLKTVLDSCQTIGAGLLGIVRTATISDRDIEYIRLCSSGIFGSLLFSPPKVLSNRQAEIRSLVKQLEDDIYPLYSTGNTDAQLKVGPKCGWNSVNIVKALQNKYDVSMIHIEPIKKNASWRNHLGTPSKMSTNLRIRQRNALWGVGTTLGVIYHALPVFKFPEQNLYISVETTLTCLTSQLQFHITESMESMLDFLQFRYMATSPPVETLTLGSLLHSKYPNRNFLNFNKALPTTRVRRGSVGATKQGGRRTFTVRKPRV